MTGAAASTPLPDSTDAPVVCDSIVDALLPGHSDPALDELANCVFYDGDVEVKVSPVDELMMAFARGLLSDARLGRAGVVQLPRCSHRNTLLLAICSQLLCRRVPSQMRGPVVFVGFDVDISDQLRALKVSNHRRMGLSDGNPLSVHRLTRSGELVPVVGTSRGTTDTSLVYFNTRVGGPTLDCGPPLVIIDATNVTHPVARRRVLEWSTDEAAAAILAVGDLGDDDLIRSFEGIGLVPTVLALSSPEFTTLARELGRQTTSESTLSSMGLLWLDPTSVVVHRMPPGVVDDAVTHAFAAVAAKPDGPVPSELELPLKLLRNGSRLAARVRDYKTACTNNVRPGEMPIVRSLDRMSFNVPGAWHSWGVTKLGSLKVGVRTLWNEIEQDNPKLLELWRVLGEIERINAGALTLIRCHSRAAMEATRSSLSSGDRTELQIELWDRIAERAHFSTFKDRFPANAFDVQILTGAPPPWLTSILLGVEAVETHVLVYSVEESLIRSQLQRWAQRISGWRGAAARSLAVANPPQLSSPLSGPEETTPERVAATLRVPGLSLMEVLDRASDGIDASDAEVVPETHSYTLGQRECVPVVLDDGRTWWCIDEGEGRTPVLTLTAGGQETRPVVDLRPGDRIVVPAGDGIESIHARLVAASRSNDDVRSLDILLSQFRSAARAVRGNGTQSEAVERVRIAGAQAFRQLPHWESGATIAPREPDDVAAVFRAAGRPCPDLALVYAVAGKLRSLSQTLGKFVAAMAAGRGDDAVEKLRALVGPVADELLDEFVIVTVREVRRKRLVSAAIAGQLR